MHQVVLTLCVVAVTMPHTPAVRLPGREGFQLLSQHGCCRWNCKWRRIVECLV